MQELLLLIIGAFPTIKPIISIFPARPQFFPFFSYGVTIAKKLSCVVIKSCESLPRYEPMALGVDIAEVNWIF